MVLASDPLYADEITAAFHQALLAATDPACGLAGVPAVILYKLRYPSREQPYFEALSRDFDIEVCPT